MWRMLFVSSSSCSVPSGWFVSVLFHCQVSPCPFPLGMMVPSWNVLHRVPAWRQSSTQGGRGGFRAFVWPSWLPIGMTMLCCCLAHKAKQFLGCS
jgi:hypothetical protein